MKKGGGGKNLEHPNTKPHGDFFMITYIEASSCPTIFFPEMTTRT